MIQSRYSIAPAREKNSAGCASPRKNATSFLMEVTTFSSFGVSGGASAGASCTKRNRSSTQTHDTNSITNDQNYPPHVTTLEGGAATVRTTRQTRAGTSCE